MMMSAAAPTALPAAASHKFDPSSADTSNVIDEKKENPSSEDVAAAAAGASVAAGGGGGYMAYHQHAVAAAAHQPYALYPNGMMMAAAAPHHHPQAQQAAHQFMTGMAPQQQVYIGMALQQQQQQTTTAMATKPSSGSSAKSKTNKSQNQPQYQSGFMLQSQFQSLSLDANTGSGGGATGDDGGSSSSNNNLSSRRGGNNNDDDGGGGNHQGDGDGGNGDLQLQQQNPNEDDEDEPVKLFVGQVPKNMNEEDIFPTFDAFGPLKDVSIIRDKHTQLHRGCAFVTYWSASDAEKAQAELHGKHTFPGGRRPAQVKPAEASVRENKLFIGMLSKETSEEDIRQMFEPFGEIKEIFLIRNQDGSSKCAAFLRYISTDSAEQAISAMHSSMTLEGAQRPLIVKYADNKRQREQRHIRNIRRHEMMTIPPGAYGYPPHMAMGPPAPSGHPHQYPIPGSHPQYGPPYPTPAGAHAYQTHHLYAAPPQYGTPHHAPYGAFQHQPPGNRHGNDSAASSSSGGNSAGEATSNNSSRNPNPRPREGPAGANLFVYHLPHDLTDADLATAFNPFGNVISAKVYVDRFTGESKGFGFVSYDSVIAAESAIEQMNGFQIGNKRLKVQHKRVHVNQGGGGNDGSDPNFMAHPQMAQMMTFDPSGGHVVLDTGLDHHAQVVPPGEGT